MFDSGLLCTRSTELQWVIAVKRLGSLFSPDRLFSYSLGQKLFSCHVCSNSFSTKGSLKVHMRLHTGAKPFKCPHCDLRFRTSGRRKTHIQCHFKPEAKKARKPAPRTPAEGLQPVNLLNSSSTDPNVFIMNNSVLTGQFDQNLLPQGLVGQAILPASMSGKHCRCSAWGLKPLFCWYYLIRKK